MTPGTHGPLLLADDIDRFRPAGAFGQPAWQSHAALRALIQQRLGERCADYLAVPVLDPDTRVMRWTASRGGAAPQPWATLEPAQRERFALDVQDIRGRLAALAVELRQGAGTGTRAFGSLLEQALKVPASGSFLFQVGDQPMIAFWGFEDQQGRSVDPAIGLAAAAASTTPPARGARPPPPLPSAPERAGPNTPSTARTDTVRRRPWWQWLLFGLLGLTLLALLLGTLRACLPSLGGARLPGAPSGIAVPGLGGPGVQRAGPSGTSTDTSTEAFEPRPGSAPSAPAGAASEAGAPAPAAAGDAPAATPPKAPALPAALTPPLPSPSDPAAPAPGAPPPRPAADPRAMKLPSDPATDRSMDFLLGNWKAGEGLADKNTRQPLDLSLRFGPGGAGEVTLRRPDGVQCSGPVQGQMQGQRLVVEGNQSVPCAGGGSYGAPRIECSRGPGGQADCQGVNRDGSRYYMDMRRP